MDMSNGQGRRTTVGVILVVIAILVAVDVATDLASGTDLVHAALELVVIGAAVAGAVMMWRSGRREVEALRADLSASRAEVERWRTEAKEAVEGLSIAIDHQFDRWSLTGAEREVCLLLLKGLSLKDVAIVRSTSERTAREQARAIYKKSALAGRAELAAFFLEDLLAPRTPVERS